MGRIDTSKLQVGKIYSYKQLCELTNVEYKQGAGRTAYLEGMGENGFHRFFNFEKSGYGKYKVTEIYETPIDIIDKRKIGGKSVYSVYIELLLMQHLSKQKSSHVETFMRKDLWLMLGMVNEKYGNISSEKLKDINSMFTKFEIKNFYVRSNQKLERILTSALNNLKNRFLIEWELLTIIHTEKSGKEEWIVANDEQKKEILVAKREVLTKLGYDNAFQIFIHNKQEDFFEEVNDLLYERFGWDYFFKRYKIIFDAKNIQAAIPETELNLNKILLNKKIVDYSKTEAQKLYDKSINRYNETLNIATDANELATLMMNTWKLPDNYVLVQSLLADELIKIDYDEKVVLEQALDMDGEYEAMEQFFSLNLLDSD